MDFDSNDLSDDEGQRLFAAFQHFWKQQNGIHQKATTSIPQKRIVEEDSEDELEEDSSEDDGGDGEDLYGTQAPFNSIRRGQSNCVGISLEPDWAPRTVHPRTVPNRTVHFRAESPPRSEFSSASRTESAPQCSRSTMYGSNYIRAEPN